MMGDRYRPEYPKESRKAPEARYAYYRRCQVFRRNGEQCKAPAEKGSQICYAHAGQLAMAVRREQDRRALLAEAVAEMCRQGRPEYEMADLFTDFKGIQVTLAVVARAVINSRIDCKTAGQMLVQLQTLSKLLWQIHRQGREGRKGRKDLPLIHTDNTDLKNPPKRKSLPLINADVITESWGHEQKQGLPQICSGERRLKPEGCAAELCVRRQPDCGGARVLQFDAMQYGDGSRAHGPPELKAA